MNEIIVLFGASLAGEAYLNSLPHHHNIIAIVDNDPKKHGKKLFNIPILSPEVLSTIEFDKIIITSAWDKDITKQLINELGVLPSKINLSPKSITKRPFFCDTTRQLAETTLISISNYLAQNKINAFLDFGTLLGYVRDNGPIPWDSDLDLSLNESDYFLFIKLVPELLSLNLNVRLSPQLFPGGLALNVEPLNKNAQSFAIDVFKRFSDAEGFSCISCAVGEFEKAWRSPKIHFEQCEQIDVQGHALFVPYKRYDYLKLLYGDWEKPNPGFTVDDWKNTY